MKAVKVTKKRSRHVVAFLAVLVVVLFVVVGCTRQEVAITVVSYSDQTLGYDEYRRQRLEEGYPSDQSEFVRRPDSLYAVVPQGLKIGARPYTDRQYVVTELPESLVGLTLLQTCNGHKARRGPEFEVTLSLPQASGVFLAVDGRVFTYWEATGVVPAWLKEYRVTQHRIFIAGVEPHREYKVLFKEVGPGRMTLGESGGWGGRRNNSMYFVFFCDLHTAKELGAELDKALVAGKGYGENLPAELDRVEKPLEQKGLRR